MVWYQMPGTIQVFHADERGSIVALTDRSGNIERIHSYDAYGREGAAAHLGRFGYAGGVALPEAGLTHFRARAYDPGTGRFVSADPIGVAGGINLYGYAGDDPIDRTDPDGTEPKPQITEIVVEGQRKKPPSAPPPPPVQLGWILNLNIAGSFSRGVDIYFPGPGYFSTLFNKAVDASDPDSVEGASPEEVEEAAKAKGWTEKDAKTGPDKGKRFTDASGNNGIRIMGGGGNRTGVDAGVKSGGPYAQIVGGRNAGKVVPLAGNRTLTK